MWHHERYLQSYKTLACKTIVTGKIFKSLAISQLVDLALITLVPNNVIIELKKMQKNFLQGNESAKINLDTWNYFNNGGLKSADISSKLPALKSSWIQYWIVVPLKYIQTAFEMALSHISHHNYFALF